MEAMLGAHKLHDFSQRLLLFNQKVGNLILMSLPFVRLAPLRADFGIHH